MPSNEKKDLRCSFCGRTQAEVKRLIAGPGVYICNECIEICADLIGGEEEEAALQGLETMDKLPTPAEIKEGLDQ